MRITRLASCVLFMSIAACATNDDGLNPPPPPGGQQLVTDTFHLAPGQEIYMCYQFYSPDEEVAITRVESLSVPGVHHLGIYQAFGRNEDDAPHECAVLIKDSWLPIWGSGTGRPDLTLPVGVGFKIPKHTQYIVQLHLQNASDKAMDIKTGLNLTYTRDVEHTQPAGMYALGTFSLTVPPQTNDYQVPIRNCHPNKEMNVFAVFPHMHKIGTQLEVTHDTGTGTQAPFYKIDPWIFGNQPMDPMDIKINTNDNFEMTCHYDNHTDTPVVYGESSDQEMCFFVLFYYPFDGLDGCIDG